MHLSLNVQSKAIMFVVRLLKGGGEVAAIYRGEKIGSLLLCAYIER